MVLETGNQTFSLKVVVVDDNESDRQLLREALDRLPVKIEVAKALKPTDIVALMGPEPTVLILDYRLGEDNPTGFDLIDTLLGKQEMPMRKLYGFWVIAVSGWPREKLATVVEAKQQMSAIPQDYVSKQQIGWEASCARIVERLLWERLPEVGAFRTVPPIRPVPLFEQIYIHVPSARDPKRKSKMDQPSADPLVGLRQFSSLLVPPLPWIQQWRHPLIMFRGNWTRYDDVNWKQIATLLEPARRFQIIRLVEKRADHAPAEIEFVGRAEAHGQAGQRDVFGRRRGVGPRVHRHRAHDQQHAEADHGARIERAHVMADDRHGEQRAITQGVQAGERVVASGLMRVKPGMKVRAADSAARNG